MQSNASYILIDNGYPAKRTYLEKELEKAGCRPGNLKLIVLTHGDHDHAGNSTFLRDKYSVKIAMHSDDSVMVEKGDMNWNRKDKPDKFSIMFRAMSLMSFFFKPGEFEKFIPDLFIDESFELPSAARTLTATPYHRAVMVHSLYDFGSLSLQTNGKNCIRNEKPLCKNQICNTLINDTNFCQ